MRAIRGRERARDSRWRGAASSTLVSRSRACRPEVGVPVPASREAERRYVVRWPSARACRPPPPEVGVPLPASRGRAAMRRALAFGPRVPTGGRRSRACLVRQSGDASCAGLRPARADRRSAFPCLRLVRQSSGVVRWPSARACRPEVGAGLRPARADRRSAFPCLRLVRQSGDASCAGLRPARADRRSAFPCLRLVRQSGDASCAGLRPARADRMSREAERERRALAFPAAGGRRSREATGAAMRRALASGQRVPPDASVS